MKTTTTILHFGWFPRSKNADRCAKLHYELLFSLRMTQTRLCRFRMRSHQIEKYNPFFWSRRQLPSPSNPLHTMYNYFRTIQICIEFRSRRLSNPFHHWPRWFKLKTIRGTRKQNEKRGCIQKIIAQCRLDPVAEKGFVHGQSQLRIVAFPQWPNLERVQGVSRSGTREEWVDWSRLCLEMESGTATFNLW